MVTFSFLATTYLLADILPILARLSKRFQRSQVDFTTVTDGISVTTAALTSFKKIPGPKLEKFLSEIPAEPESGSFYYLGHKIPDSQRQRNDFASNRTKLIDKLIDNLKSRFPDAGIISSFAILDPQNLPSPADLPSYGRGGGTGTASTAVAVPLLWRMRLSRTKIGAILMTSLRLVLALTPAAQDDKCGEKNKYRKSSAPTKTGAVPSTLALSQGI